MNVTQIVYDALESGSIQQVEKAIETLNNSERTDEIRGYLSTLYNFLISRKGGF